MLELVQNAKIRSPLTNDPLYVVVEGPIGVGKTTLVHRLKERMDAHLVLEVVEENPFLSQFYANPKRYAFQTQLFFLMSRFRQQKELYAEGCEVQGDFLADYHLLKDRIFAELTLEDEELALYGSVYESLAMCIRKPDVLIYLTADEKSLIERIERRARPFEKDFDRRYLARLSERYQHHFSDYSDTPLLKLNTTRINYVTDQKPIDEIYKEVRRLATNWRAGLGIEACISSNFK